MNRTCRKWKAFGVFVAAWQVGPAVFPTARAVELLERGSLEGGEECGNGSALLDRNLDQRGSMGSQLARVRLLLKIDRSGHFEEITNIWPKNGDDSKFLPEVCL